MSDTPETKKEPEKEKAKEKKGGGGLIAVVGIILPALLAGGASYGGVRAAGKGGHGGEGGEHDHADTETVHHDERPPGPTVALDPFLVAIPDANRKSHPMKLSIAVEFDAMTKEDTVKSFTPRMRDAVLSYVRGLSYEDATDSQHSEKFRSELLEKCKGAGAATAERVLITDMVSQ